MESDWDPEARATKKECKARVLFVARLKTKKQPGIVPMKLRVYEVVLVGFADLQAKQLLAG